MFLIELWIEIPYDHMLRDANHTRKVCDTMNDVHFAIAFSGVISLLT